MNAVLGSENEVESLVRLAREGDRQAFGRLAELFQRNVQGLVASRLRDSHEAAEVVQEVFIHAMLKIGQLRDPACFGAWLRKIAVRLSINRALRRPPFPTVESQVLEQREARSQGPLEILMQREDQRSVRLAVASLRKIDREALVAFYLKSKSLAEIASELDVPLGTIKRRLHVARYRLQKALRPDEPVHDGGVGGDMSEPQGYVTSAGSPRAPKARAGKKKTKSQTRRRELALA